MNIKLNNTMLNTQGKYFIFIIHIILFLIIGKYVQL